MSIIQRAFLGAVFGAIIALFIHPLSRPWFQYGLYRFEPSPSATQSPHLAQTLVELPEPTSDQNLSLAIQFASEQLTQGTQLNPADTLLLIELCRTAAEKDPTNAYWRQSEAVFQDTIGNPDAARMAWERASQRSTWEDFQPKLLELFFRDIQSESRIAMAWHPAVAAYRRSHALPQVVSEFGSRLLHSDPSLKSRGSNFLNGSLIRDNSRSRIASNFGVSLAESAATGPYPVPGSKRASAYVRAEFPTNLAKSEPNISVEQITTGLKRNEAYEALVFSRDTKTTLRKLTAQSILTASAPGAFLLTAILCGCISLLASVINPLKMPRTSPLLPAAVGLIVGVVSYLFTQDLALSLWLLVVPAIFSIRPSLELVATAPRINFSTQTLSTLLAMLFAIVVTAGIIALSAPMGALRGSLPEGWWSNPQPMIMRGALFSLGLIAILAQFQAYRYQRPAGRVLVLLLKGSFRHIALACTLCSIIATPLCIYWDSKIISDLKQIAFNETAYYLNK